MTGTPAKILLGLLLTSISGLSPAVIQTAATPPQIDSQPRYIIKYKSPAEAKAAFSLSAAQSILARAQASPLMHLPEAAASVALLDAGQLALLRADPGGEDVELDPKRFLMAEQVPYGIPPVQAPLVSDGNIPSRQVCIVDTGNWYDDGHGHGTHVAGTMSALGGNNLGVVGVSPSGNLGLHIVKVFDNNGNWAYGSDLVAAIQQCRTAGSNVISMSLGGGAPSTTERSAMDSALAAGVLVVAAAGNDSSSGLSYPAAYESVVSVAAVDSASNRASFSQYNADVEIAAPGVGVLSTTPNNTYGYMSGTSMATPHVSAVYALVWSQHTQCTAAQMRQVVNATARDRGTAGRDVYYGHGIVQAKAASDAIAANGCEVGGENPGQGETHPNLSARTGKWLYHSFNIPAGTSRPEVRTSGGSANADLYPRLGSRPNYFRWNCRPYKSGNEEVCTLDNPSAGTWYTGLRARSQFSGVTLSWQYQ